MVPANKVSHLSVGLFFLPRLPGRIQAKLAVQRFPDAMEVVIKFGVDVKGNPKANFQSN